jgi:two-component system chemotaxis sensor kinase CheA
MVDVLLESADASRGLLACHQSGNVGQGPATAGLVSRIRTLVSGEVPTPAVVVKVAETVRAAQVEPVAVTQPTPVVATVQTISGGMRHLEIRFIKLDQPTQAEAIVELFRDIPGLGEIKPLTLDGVPADSRVFEVQTTSSNEDLLDLFAFHVSREHVVIADIPGSGDSDDVQHSEGGAALGQVASATDATAFGFFDGSPGAPQAHIAESLQITVPVVEAGATKVQSPARVPAVNSAPPEAATIRVAISKVDQLINLVGELVITQAMLAQNSRALDPAVCQQLLTGLTDLDRNTRDLQESVMSIRMIPMSIVFNRFPRMLRDLANKLGKKVDFVTQGEATELDKGLVEKITDPLTHLVRNSCDHGIESPEERVRAGKPETGTITLSASHQGGSIVIEVRDDGKGMSRQKILTKARERGLDVSDQMSDAEVWQLIFAPGFSTAEVVTDVSGRGVGMDVVKRNIASLNGTVEIESSEGIGMKVSVRLPLTLAIMDGMSVGVGNEVYILPLSSVVESFQVKSDAVSTVGQGAQLVKVRDEYMPVIELEKVFQVPRYDSDKVSDIMVVIEADSSRVVLLVDELLGQQQVVVKNLESNYRKVPNVSGATILGDGKVALILDTGALVRRSRH